MLKVTEIYTNGATIGLKAIGKQIVVHMDGDKFRIESKWSIDDGRNNHQSWTEVPCDSARVVHHAEKLEASLAAARDDLNAAIEAAKASTASAEEIVAALSTAAATHVDAREKAWQKFDRRLLREADAVMNAMKAQAD